MSQKYRIQLYSNTKKSSSIHHFIIHAEPRLQAKISHSIRLLAEFGGSLGLPHAKKLNGFPMWELRIVGNDSCRILYTRIKNNTFVLLHIFLKKRNKIPQKDLALAEKRRALIFKQFSEELQV